MATTDIIHVAGSLEPNFPAAVFLGGNTDDYLQVDAGAVGMVAASYTSGTIAAWVMPADITQTGTIVGAGDKNVVEFIELNVEAGKLVARCTDNTTAAWVVTSDNVVCPAHTWTHVALVHNGVLPVLYVNGERVAQTMTTTTAKTKWFVDCSGIDSMRIGAANKAGDDSVTQEFGGGIARVHIWGGLTSAGALTQDQVKLDMNRVSQTTALYNSYDFVNNALTDSGTGADPATKVGDVVMSDAYCEFESKLRTRTPVTADNPRFAITGETGHCFFVESA